MNLNLFDTNIKGLMTPTQFIQECVDDIPVDEIKQVVKQNGFILNGQIISDPEILVSFKSGDTVIFKAHNLQFNIV